MTWSIRGLLTAWYSVVIVVVLACTLLVVDVLQQRLLRQHLDEEVARQMLTLQGVMRTEISEGLSLRASADEASIEVIAPGRHLMLLTPDGGLLASWGLAIDPSWRPDLDTEVIGTLVVGTTPLRVFSQPVTFREHRYVAAVLAPLTANEQAQQDLRRSLGIALLLALTLAALGGWVIARRTLRPLEDMAAQATAITASTATTQLSIPRTGDELARLATAFNGLLDRLVHALHAQRQFMADASHELRTPVSVVRSAAQVTLSRETRSPEDYREMMHVVDEQAERLARLVNTMFLLSRAEANGLPVRHEPLYLDDLVSECARAARMLAEERHITIRADHEEAVAYKGDPDLLRQMLTNLLDNAVRHARTRVTLSVRESESQISIQVIDDGEGIPHEAHARVFERFARLTQRYPGAGLGLPIARWVAQAHSGALRLLASGEAGTIFEVTLPLRAGEP